MHADVKPTASASFLCVFPAFPLFGCNVCERETPTYLPHPGHSYFYADNGGPLVFVTPKYRSPPPFAWTFIHVCDIRGDTDAVTLYAEVGSINAGVYRYSSPLTGFFFPMELLGPGPTLRCYWPTQTQSPAPACVT